MIDFMGQVLLAIVAFLLAWPGAVILVVVVSVSVLILCKGTGSEEPSEETSIEDVAFEILRLAAIATEQAPKAEQPVDRVAWWCLAEGVTEAVSAATTYAIDDDRLAELAEKADREIEAAA